MAAKVSALAMVFTISAGFIVHLLALQTLTTKAIHANINAIKVHPLIFSLSPISIFRSGS
jgi:hypothetical protein